MVELLDQSLAALRGDFDAEHGGFGQGAKFPRPPALDLLLTSLERKREPEVELLLVRTLDDRIINR